jgi:alkanesulfonate monooxygenase SsuD/methylene tetrahydromethanopterin reductase-like flavin-dependent oxidoreductase (luciferase family)
MDPTTGLRVGLFPPLDLLERGASATRAFLAAVGDAGLDHVCCGDHVSFGNGTGFDGLVQATALAMSHPALPVHTGVYLLPLRHPVLVARQLADIDRLAPGRLGDGWLGIWNSPRRFAEAVALAGEAADRAGRTDYPARHAMQVWCGLAASREEARRLVARAMQAFYRMPFESFERYTPYGTPADVAGLLAPYVAAGCTEFNLIPQGTGDESTVAAVAEVKRLLAGSNMR